ncbi:MAG: DNA mismatch repair endonuclease MutL [Lachnospiraceae bacterium]|nr:DNA mismatch repair endonuclease MutL [Lachnospiraceae bacterium]
MPKIELLDEQTIDKIAAGEVVERPSSVVKELVENAIDARATAVTVEIRDGGTTLIRITDNGCGIEKEQIPIAFFRHSTSKIRSVEDLITISSLGFRGEALSSIASVSQVELITKTMESLTGCRYLIEGGKEILLEETGAPDGTTFLVKNLFYNTPARRKFLKSPQTEAGYISDMMERIALSHPDISFKFINNGQIRLHTSGNSRLKDIIYHIYGRDIAANLLEVNGEFEGFSVSGFIGKPVVSRGNRNFESYFINGRYIKSKLIAKAIEDGYHGFMMQHKYPFTVLLISVDGKLVDVNVHPNKMELRFSDGEQLYRSLFHLIQSILKNRKLIADVGLESGKKANAKPTYDKNQIPEPFEKNRLRQVREEEGKEDTGRSSADSFLHTAEPQPPEASIEREIPVSQSVREPLRYGNLSAPNRDKDSGDTASHRQVANGEDLLQNNQLFPDTDSAHQNHQLTRESDTLRQNQISRQNQAVPDHETEQQPMQQTLADYDLPETDPPALRGDKAEAPHHRTAV